MIAPQLCQTALEQQRAADVMSLVPRGYRTVLDAGCREGSYSLRLTEYFDSVTALDLRQPLLHHAKVTCVAGDLTRLTYPDRSFDVVFCTEVLEHIPALEQAVSEIKRVVRHAVVIGVPYKQDIRIGRTTCAACGRISPPWGHVNVFDEQRIVTLFRPFHLCAKLLTGVDSEKTNALAAWFTDKGRNPYGIYERGQQCLHCGESLEVRPSQSLLHRVSAGVGVRLMKTQSTLSSPHANWIHLVLER